MKTEMDLKRSLKKSRLTFNSEFLVTMTSTCTFVIHTNTPMKTNFIFYSILLSCCLVFNNTLSQNADRDFKYPNIILLIGDGNGLSQISAGNYVMGNQTAFDRFEFVGLIKVHADEVSILTDSAAAGTAIACGKKTKSGMLGMDAEKNELTSILEILKGKGYQTGLIATSTIVHATPAAFYAKVEARSEYELIASQLMSSSVDFFVGGGEKYFIEREDGKNLIKEFKQFEFVDNLDDFRSSQSEKIGYLTHENNPPSLLEGRTPTLGESLSVLLEKFDSNKPFFAMVEGSQIDWAGHDNDIEFLISEFKEFNQAIDISLDFAENNPSTLVIATADHETGGLSVNNGNLENNTIIDAWGTGGHTATFVPVFSFGYDAIEFSGLYENTEIFHKLKNIVSH